jgi:molybdate transport system substrate-binding protein
MILPLSFPSLLLLSSLLVPIFAQEKPALLVAAASDLISVQDALVKAFDKQSGLQIRFTFGSSGALARQIASGAPYDVFISADEARVAELTKSGALLPDSVAVYAIGRIAIWSKARRFHRLEELAAANLRHIAIANPAHAPYGVAARQALEKTALWPKIQDKIVYGESVRQALDFAETGNAEAAITAWPLVARTGGVLLPSTLHAPIRQAGGVVKSSRNPDAARAFVRFLGTVEAQQVLQAAGFDGPESAR